MNKFTYLLLLLFCMMGGVTKAYAGIGDPLEKSGWSITASSWCWDDRVDGNDMTASSTVTSKTFGIPTGVVSMEAKETAALCLNGSSLT